MVWYAFEGNLVLILKIDEAVVTFKADTWDQSARYKFWSKTQEMWCHARLLNHINYFSHLFASVL